MADDETPAPSQSAVHPKRAVEAPCGKKRGPQRVWERQQQDGGGMSPPIKVKP